MGAPPSIDLQRFACMSQAMIAIDTIKAVQHLLDEMDRKHERKRAERAWLDQLGSAQGLLRLFPSLKAGKR